MGKEGHGQRVRFVALSFGLPYSLHVSHTSFLGDVRLKLWLLVALSSGGKGKFYVNLSTQAKQSHLNDFS